jgi:hypothetical protein
MILAEGAAPAASLLLDCKTLYIEGFLAGDNNWYYFSDTHEPKNALLGIAGNTVQLLMKGTHAALETHTEGNVFDANTKAELRKLTAFRGGSDTGLKLALSFAAVVCSEAIRFKEIGDKIESVLTGGTISYKTRADWGNLFKNWQALTTANSAKVTVVHIA